MKAYVPEGHTMPPLIYTCMEPDHTSLWICTFCLLLAADRYMYIIKTLGL